MNHDLPDGIAVPSLDDGTAALVRASFEVRMLSLSLASREVADADPHANTVDAFCSAVDEVHETLLSIREDARALAADAALGIGEETRAYLRQIETRTDAMLAISEHSVSRCRDLALRECHGRS